MIREQKAESAEIMGRTQILIGRMGQASFYFSKLQKFTCASVQQCMVCRFYLGSAHKSVHAHSHPIAVRPGLSLSKNSSQIALQYSKLCSMMK